MESGSVKNQSVNSLDHDGLVANSIAAPICSGICGQVYWTGGSNIIIPESTKSTYDLRHEDYKGLMKTEETCNAELPERFRLDVSGKNTNLNLKSWID